MALTALQIAREFCKRQSLTLPLALVSATDDTTAQINGLMNEGIADLVQRYRWPQLQMLQTFLHANGTDYLAYNLDSLANFGYLVQETLWDQTDRLRVLGPATEDEWTQIVTMAVAPARYTFRKRLAGLYIYPVPTILSAVTFSFEFVSSKGVWNGTNYTDFYETDTSTSLLPSTIILQDLKWRWRQAKGFPYAEDEHLLEEMVAQSIAREPLPKLILDGPSGIGIAPVILVPSGSWNVP